MVMHVSNRGGGVDEEELHWAALFSIDIDRIKGRLSSLPHTYIYVYSTALQLDCHIASIKQI